MHEKERRIEKLKEAYVDLKVVLIQRDEQFHAITMIHLGVRDGR